MFWLGGGRCVSQISLRKLLGGSPLMGTRQLPACSNRLAPRPAVAGHVVWLRLVLLIIFGLFRLNFV
jgi:hypothetical protein